MKTTKEKIEIMQAFERGEQIQYAEICSNVWYDEEEPVWDWFLYNYRVKPKPKLVPYENSQEFYEAMKAHGGYIKKIDSEGTLRFPTTIESDGIFIADVCLTYEELLKEYEFVDGTPCGKEVME